MVKFQRNFTTPEQSKHLLDLGLPEDSADCYFHENRRKELESKLQVLNTALVQAKVLLSNLFH